MGIESLSAADVGTGSRGFISTDFNGSASNSIALNVNAPGLAAPAAGQSYQTAGSGYIGPDGKMVVSPMDSVPGGFLGLAATPENLAAAKAAAAAARGGGSVGLSGTVHQRPRI